MRSSMRGRSTDVTSTPSPSPRPCSRSRPLRSSSEPRTSRRARRSRSCASSRRCATAPACRSSPTTAPIWPSSPGAIWSTSGRTTCPSSASVGSRLGSASASRRTTLEQLDAALAARPDYVAFGPVFPTTTKMNPDPVVGVAGLSAAYARARAAGIPLVAIGGITYERARSHRRDDGRRRRDRGSAPRERDARCRRAPPPRSSRK